MKLLQPHVVVEFIYSLISFDVMLVFDNCSFESLYCAFVVVAAAVQT